MKLVHWLVAALGVAVLSVDGWGCASGVPINGVVVDSDTDSIWLPATNLGHDAQLQWGKAARFSPTFEFIPEDALQVACNLQPDHFALGCYSYEFQTIYVRNDITPLYQDATILHEMGHFLGHAEHINEGSSGCAHGSNETNEYVMCYMGAIRTDLTMVDHEWMDAP